MNSTASLPPQDQNISVSGKTNEGIASSASTTSIPSTNRSSSNNMSARSSATPMSAPMTSSSGAGGDDGSSSDTEATNANYPTISTLSPYEVFRAKNIERNQRRLASLGLVSEVEAQKIIDSAWKKTQSQTSSPSRSRNCHKNQKLTATAAVSAMAKKLVNDHNVSVPESSQQQKPNMQNGIGQSISIKVGKGGAKKRILDRASLSQISDEIIASFSDSVCADTSMSSTSTCIIRSRGSNDFNANGNTMLNTIITETVSSDQNGSRHPDFQIVTPTSIGKQKHIINYAIDPEDLTSEDGIWC